jgi:transposase InsO family protein
VCAVTGEAERRVCKVLGQPRATQRYAPRIADDEPRLRADIITLAATYGRYGYRRIWAMLRRSGWDVNRKRVQRIWREEGLRVPKKQPKRGRGSCIRLRPERRNHVWSYDFVQGRTTDGRKFRMLTVIDEFTRECLAIHVHVARRIRSMDVLCVIASLMCERGVPEHIRSDNGPEFTATAIRKWIAKVGCQTLFIEPGVHGDGDPQVDRQGGLPNALHRAGEPVGERLQRELQREAPGRAAEAGDLQHAARGQGADRGLALGVQPHSAAQLTGLSPAGARSDRRCRAAFRCAPGSSAAVLIALELVQTMGSCQQFLRLQVANDGGAGRGTPAWCAATRTLVASLHSPRDTAKSRGLVLIPVPK